MRSAFAARTGGQVASRCAVCGGPKYWNEDDDPACLWCGRVDLPPKLPAPDGPYKRRERRKRR